MTDTYEEMGRILPSAQMDFSSLKIDAKGIVDAGKKGGKDLVLKKLIEALPLPEDQKTILNWFASSQYDYTAWCMTEGQAPYTKQSILAYVVKKGPKAFAESAKSFGKYTHEQNVICISTIAAVVLEFRSRVGLLRGGPIGATAGLGLMLLDLIEVGNSCEFVQEGYYDLFLKSSDIQLKPVRKKRMSVPSDQIYQVLSPTIDTAHKTMMCSKAG
ncbi:MAG TPA: hypothetical protein VMQ93_16055 [Novosphingobium sp.]|nr:hypothetical protein [Novosphingobium sp.]